MYETMRIKKEVKREINILKSMYEKTQSEIISDMIKEFKDNRGI